MPVAKIDEQRLALNRRMIDLLDADQVSVAYDGTGKLWINLGGVCVMRVGHVKRLVLEDYKTGRERVVER